MGKSELFDMKIVGPISRWLQGFPVKRYTADRAALRFAEGKLKAGEAVVVFPEGKLSEDGTLQPMLPGALLIARSANVPVVPTIIIGADRIIPYGSVTPRYAGKKSIVRFGPPVSIETLTDGLKGGDALKRGAERLGAIMAALQRGEPYPTFEPHQEEAPEEPPSPSPAV